MGFLMDDEINGVLITGVKTYEDYLDITKKAKKEGFEPNPLHTQKDVEEWFEDHTKRNIKVAVRLDKKTNQIEFDEEMHYNQFYFVLYADNIIQTKSTYLYGGRNV